MRLKFVLAAFLLLAHFGMAEAALTLKDYQQWQQYNGWKIFRVAFPGIDHFARSDLAGIIATDRPPWYRQAVQIGPLPVFFAEDFAGDLFRLEHFYAREGFPYARVTGEVIPRNKRSELVVKFHIEEGPPLILSGWNIVQVGEKTGALDSTRWAKKFPITIGKRLAESDIQATADTMQYKLRNNAHARARVTYEIQRDSVNNTAHLTFFAHPGPYCLFGPIRITGLKQVGEKTARRELAFKDGDPYSLGKQEETRQNLFRLQTFNLVNVRPDTTVLGNQLPITVETIEGKRYHAGGGVGYDSDQKWRISAEFRDLNFFGRGRRFTWGGSLSKILRSTEMTLFFPHTPLKPTDFTIAPKWERRIEKDYSRDIGSATSILSARPLPLVTVALSNEYGPAKIVQKVTAERDTTYTLIRSIETLTINWDTRDNPLVPRKGHALSADFSESGAFYRTHERWWRSRFSGVGLLPVSRFTILAGRAQIGVMGPLHDTNVTPRDERFYLGGPDNVRGWVRHSLSPRSADDVSVGGNFSFFFSAEVRRNIFGPITLAGFLDAGNVWQNERTWKAFNLYPSAGLGLLIISPLGPLRLDYAHQIRSNPFNDKQAWAIDLSLGAPF
jgi:outer membrane protein assembly complex protein YaeT